MKKEITCSENGSIRLMDKIIVTDPCYKEKIWCNEVVDNVLPGNYKIYIRRAKSEKYMYDGISRLIVIHEDYVNHFMKNNKNLALEKSAKALSKTNLTMEMNPTEIGVDSGTCGFLNHDYYFDIVKTDKEYDEKLFDALYNMGDLLTIEECGVMSTNWFGDGGYELWLFSTEINDKKTVVAMVINYKLEKMK